MTKTCINCSEKVKETDIFCPFCGANANEVHPSAKISSVQDTKMGIVVCSTCGDANKQGTKFCENCGNAIASSSSSSSVNYGTSTASTSTSSTHQTTHTYGSYSTEPEDSTRKWYQPPKRTRSAKHPLEWFFWTGWGFYFLLRVVFQVLWLILRIVLRSKGRRF